MFIHLFICLFIFYFPFRIHILTIFCYHQVLQLAFKSIITITNTNITKYVIQTATHKGIAVVQNLLSQQHSVPDTNTTLVISADTIVEAEGKVYEKPRLKQHQFETLKHLKDNRLLIEVKTAVIAFVIPGDAKSKPQKQQQQQQYQGLDARAEGNAQNLLLSLGIATSTHLECTKVYMDFDNITDSFLQSYVDSGEGSGAAGGFKIQGIGGLLFKEIEGDYCNVVGLPFTSTFRLIEKALLG